jgi:ParB/RepB/Spo0J family partition protein
MAATRGTDTSTPEESKLIDFASKRALSRMSIEALPPQDLMEDPDNERPPIDRESESFLALCESIRAEGVKEPLQVYRSPAGGTYILAGGHRRRAAAVEVGLALVPCVVSDPPADMVARAVTRLTLNLHREDINPVEQARTVKALLDADPTLTQAELGRRLGKSQEHISKLVRVLDLPEGVLAMVRDGKLSQGHAVALLGINEPTIQSWDGNQIRDVAGSMVALAEQAVTYRFSVREVESRVKSHNSEQVRNRKYAEERQARHAANEVTSGDAREDVLKRLVEGEATDKELDALLLQRHQEEMSAYHRRRNDLSEARQKVFGLILVESMGLTDGSGVSIDHVRLLALESLLHGVATWTPDFKEKLEKITAMVEGAESIEVLLRLLVDDVVRRMVPTPYSTAVGMNQNDHVQQWANQKWKLDKRLAREWKERGLQPENEPIPPDKWPPEQREKEISRLVEEARLRLEQEHQEPKKDLAKKPYLTSKECARCGALCKAPKDFRRDGSPDGRFQSFEGDFLTPHNVYYCPACAPGVQMCLGCGCTDEDPCEVGCGWATRLICTACADGREGVPASEEELAVVSTG